MGLATKSGNQWQYKDDGVHIPKESPWNLALQLNRRALAQKSITINQADTTHFSTVFTIDEKDLTKLRKSIGEFVKKSHATIHNSGTSELAYLCVDLFKI